jgi:hypothetical protein
MKKITLIAVLALVLAAFSFSPAAAGAPSTHGLDGNEFGQAVSGLARSAPGAVADHVSSSRSNNAGGVPAAHGVSGSVWGGAVSSLAQSAPGAVGSHASGK